MIIRKIGENVLKANTRRLLFGRSLSSDSSTVPDENSYDIVINGGGIVGFAFLTLANSLPHLSNKRILLLEQQKQPKYSSIVETLPRKFSNRVFSITNASRQLFEDIEIWDKLEPYAKFVDGMYVWSDHYQNAVHFGAADPLGGEPACTILENDRMLRAIHERLEAYPDISQQIQYQTTVTDIQQIKADDNEHESPLIHLKTVDRRTQDQTSITTKLLIGCDGHKSLVRSKSTLPYHEYDISQMGIVGTVQIESPFPDNSVAFQRFVSDKLVIALLPLNDNYSSFVLSVGKDDYKHWMEIDDERFAYEFNRSLVSETSPNPLNRLASGGIRASKLPTIQALVPGSRAAFPLGFGTTVPKLVGTIQSNCFYTRDFMKKYDFANTVIMGDAAHRIHPLAGQGLNLGLGDAQELGQQLEEHLERGFDLFDSRLDSCEALSNCLYQFERARLMKLIPMMGAISTMQTLMSYTPPALLSVLDSSNWLKSQIVNFANSR